MSPLTMSRYGNRLIKPYQDFKTSDDYVKENLLLVESILSRTAIQADFVKRVAKTLSEEHCRVHFETFEMLQSKLRRAVTKLESVIKKSGLKKWKLLFVRESMAELLGQLERWQRIFDPSWFLILRISNSVIDAELTNELEESTIQGLPSTEPSIASRASTNTLAEARSFRSIVKGSNTKVHISLPQDGLDWKNATPILFSATRIIQRTGSSKRCLVDTITCDSNMDIPSAKADAEDLAKKLSQTDAAKFGLLTCYGLVKKKDWDALKITSLELVFRMPSEEEPVSLRERLTQPQTFSLTETLDFARQLARAVSFVHACDFVHKNIRPETIVLFPGKDKSLGSAYLLGFDSFRSINFHTLLRGDTAWERNLYRHPTRQGLHAQDKYSMQHDVYSLGVCLLEIGLWASFVEYGEDGETGVKSPSEVLGLKLDGFGQEALDAKVSLVKDHLVALAKSKLPTRVGDKYTAVVITCLTCLDEYSTDFSEESEMQDEDGVLIGVKFIEKVLFRLSEISF